MNIIYVIPSDCPATEAILSTKAAWRGGGLIKEEDLVVPTRFDWTCAGCTAGTIDNPCPGRKCELGGYPEEEWNKNSVEIASTT